MRAVEFIYKEPGVNKPLTADDDEKKNLNGKKYRIQINKVSNAIDEVIRTLMGVLTTPVDRKIPHGQSSTITYITKAGSLDHIQPAMIAF